MKRFLLPILALAVIAVGWATLPAKALTIVDPWSRPAVEGLPTGVVYLGIVNDTREEDVLLSASSPVSNTVEIHTMVHGAGGVMRMRRLDSLPIPADSVAPLEPMGNHLMLIQMQQSLNVGDTFPLTLTFEKAGTKEVTVTVKQP